MIRLTPNLISNDLDVLENDILNIELIDKPILTTNEGYYIRNDGSGAPNSLCKIQRYEVEPNELLFLNIASSESPVTYVFKSSNSGVATNNIGIMHTTPVYNKIEKVPDGALFLFVSFSISDSTSCVKNIAPITKNFNGNVINNTNYTSNLSSLNTFAKNSIFSVIKVNDMNIEGWPTSGFNNSMLTFTSIVKSEGQHSVGDLQIIEDRYGHRAIRTHTSSAWTDWTYNKKNIVYNYDNYTITAEPNKFAAALKLVNSVTQADCEEVTLIVPTGTYDLNIELQDYFSTASELTECVINRNCKIIFEPGAKVICHYTGNNAYIKTNFSVITNNMNSIKLINANIECSNIRYCVHDEHSSRTQSYSNQYINCIMNIDNSSNGSFTYGNCIGCGLGAHAYMIVDGGIYTGISASQGDLADIRIHNSGISSGAKSHVCIKNLYASRTIGIFSYGGTTEKSEIEIVGCSLGSQIQEGFSSGATIDNMQVYAWNNEIRQS